jgi:hypothetical protein
MSSGLLTLDEKYKRHNQKTGEVSEAMRAVSNYGEDSAGPGNTRTFNFVKLQFTENFTFQ